MNLLKILFENQTVRRVTIIFSLAVMIIVGAYLWLKYHDAGIRYDERNKVTQEILSRPVSVEKETVWIKRPLPPVSKQSKPGRPIVPTPNIQSILDSAKADWKMNNANKDSLLEIYTQNREADFEDTLQKHHIIYSPLGVQPQISPFGFYLASEPKEQPPFPVENTNALKYVPLPHKWYEKHWLLLVGGAIVGGTAIVLLR
jgi:hypothetical protein